SRDARAVAAGPGSSSTSARSGASTAAEIRPPPRSRAALVSSSAPDGEKSAQPAGEVSTRRRKSQRKGFRMVPLHFSNPSNRMAGSGRASISAPLVELQRRLAQLPIQMDFFAKEGHAR